MVIKNYFLLSLFALSNCISSSPFDFNENNSAGAKLTRDSFTGKGESVSGGVAIVSAQYAYSNTDGKWHANPGRADKLYSGTLAGVGVSATLVGAKLSFTTTTLVGESTPRKK